MQDNIRDYIKDLMGNMPSDWIGLTTHRLDIYNEALAKTEFLEELEALYEAHNSEAKSLKALPTAYDYIRLGHPLSSVLEWGIAKVHNFEPEQVIAFSSQSIGILAVLRKNLLDNKDTQINYTGNLPSCFHADRVKAVYGYDFEMKKVAQASDVSEFDGTTILLSQDDQIGRMGTNSNIDVFISVHDDLGSILVVSGEKNKAYIPAIQHVRRRETVAMTPTDSLTALQAFVSQTAIRQPKENLNAHKSSVLASIKSIAGIDTTPLVGSCGLSIQYAIMMGLIDDAQTHFKGRPIKFVVPPNCYGGTNDQARRVAACLDHVEVVDLPVDGDNDMVRSIDKVLESLAEQDAIPYIIAEIPTNPRVEVPKLDDLKAVLSKERQTPTGYAAVAPVFILDQTFCPNYHFLGEGEILSTVKAISYASGSKFPSGGQCTAGYCVANAKAESLIKPIASHLELCDNEAKAHQYEILAKQLPSMKQRIVEAYKNTREFVNFIQKTLPDAKINFVSEDLAAHGFTPSVFSLDLPTKGDTAAAREAYKRKLNLKLINLMITEIPEESKFCVSYGQLKGCYWTVPATSTQGTTKEDDKDYIVRASLSPDLDVERHKAVFKEFVERI